jgi:heat shock protein beta
VSKEDYHAFYNSISTDKQPPMTYTHFSAEGEVEFKALLFFPQTRPPSYEGTEFWNTKAEVKLYVRRVLVAENIEDLLPRYLNFIRGVIDSNDLPLNVNREQIQQSKIMRVITKKLVRKSLDAIKQLMDDQEKAIETLAEEKEKDEEDEKKKEGGEAAELKKKKTVYDRFWKQFSTFLRVGCYDDDANRMKIAKLLMFRSSKSGEKHVSLTKYIQNMVEGQESIFYMSGLSPEVL